MKLTLESDLTRVEVTSKTSGAETITDVRNELLIPALLAFGYHPSNVNDLFGEEIFDITGGTCGEGMDNCELE